MCVAGREGCCCAKQTFFLEFTTIDTDGGIFFKSWVKEMAGGGGVQLVYMLYIHIISFSASKRRVHIGGKERRWRETGGETGEESKGHHPFPPFYFLCCCCCFWSLVHCSGGHGGRYKRPQQQKPWSPCMLIFTGFFSRLCSTSTL